MKTVWNGVDPFCGDALSTRSSSNGCRPERSTIRLAHRSAAHISTHSESSAITSHNDSTLSSTLHSHTNN